MKKLEFKKIKLKSQSGKSNHKSRMHKKMKVVDKEVYQCKRWREMPVL